MIRECILTSSQHEFAHLSEDHPQADIVPESREDPFEELTTHSAGTSSAAQSSNDRMRGFRHQRQRSMVSVIMEESSEDSASSSSTYYSAFHTMG